MRVALGIQKVDFQYCMESKPATRIIIKKNNNITPTFFFFSSGVPFVELRTRNNGTIKFASIKINLEKWLPDWFLVHGLHHL